MTTGWGWGPPGSVTGNGFSLWAFSFPSAPVVVVSDCSSRRHEKSEFLDKWDIDFPSCLWMCLLQRPVCCWLDLQRMGQEPG